MKLPEVKQPITFMWAGRHCVVVNNDMDDVVLCMRIGTIKGVFSVPKKFQFTSQNQLKKDYEEHI